MMLDDVADFLTAMGAPSVAWPLYKGDLPDDQDQTIAIFEAPGWPADTLGRENEIVTLQLRVRGARRDYPTVRAKWKECYDLLQDAQQVDTSPELLPGFAFIQTLAQGPLMFNDPEGRPNFTTRFKVMKARSV